MDPSHTFNQRSLAAKRFTADYPSTARMSVKAYKSLTSMMLILALRTKDRRSRDLHLSPLRAVKMSCQNWPTGAVMKKDKTILTQSIS